MRRGEKYLVAYFLVLGVLSAVALIPGDWGTIVLFLVALVFQAPGFFIVGFAPTILLYSLAALPLWWSQGRQDRRSWRFTVAACIPVLVAVGPGGISYLGVKQFVTDVSREDMARRAVAKPRSIEFIIDGRLFKSDETFGNRHAPCDDLCRRLLFNREVDWVRITRKNSLQSGASIATYRIARRDMCLELRPNGSEVTGFGRPSAEDCMIVELGGYGTADAVVQLVELYSRNRSRRSALDEETVPQAVETVKALRMHSRDGGALMPLLQKTETVAHAVALPFYVGPQGPIDRSTRSIIGHRTMVEHPIDMAQAMREIFGFALAEASRLLVEDPTTFATRIAALPPESHASFSIDQQQALKETLDKLYSRSDLSKHDVAFMDRLIADPRVGDIAAAIEPLKSLFRRFSWRLAPLIPTALERMSAPKLTTSPPYTRQYIALLDSLVSVFPADSLRPYGEKMIAAMQARPGSPPVGVLSRLAEIDSDTGIELVIHLLDSDRARKFAALAACRATADAWRQLEPAVLAHVGSIRDGKILPAPERTLLLALVRFGKKQPALDIVDRGEFSNRGIVLHRLLQLNVGFDPEHCRDMLN
jgi:hypothetical protein